MCHLKSFFMKTKQIFLFIFIFTLLLSACEPPAPPKKYDPPKIYTLQPLDISNSNAILRGRFIKGTDEISIFGFEWRKEKDSTYKTTIVQAKNEYFSFMVTDLEEDTEYVVRAFIANDDSLWYAKEFFFFSKGSLSDIDGNSYLSMRYGKTVWMTENLRVTRFADGTPIEGRSGGANSIKDGPVYYHNKDHTPYFNKTNFGLLYNWAAARNAPNCDTIFSTFPFLPGAKQGICPDGWHLPSEQEWSDLISLCGGFDYAAIQMKSSNWTDYPHAANNYSQFSIEPAGYYFFNNEGDFQGVYGNAFFWTSNQIVDHGSSLSARAVQLVCGLPKIEIINYTKCAGLSVRCVKD